MDLYLIHWPVPSQGLYVDAWRALAQARETGLTTSIGVSNFNVDHLDRIIRATGEVPVVNQIEIHPTFAQTALVAENTLRGIQTQGWRPLGAGRDLDSAAVTGVAAQTGRTPAQVVLRWHLQRGIIVFPKSVTPARIAQNLDVFDFTLTPAQMAALDDLDSGERMGLDPATM